MNPLPPRPVLCLVLHAHLPFVRHGDGAAFLEENWLPEAVLECYVPLLMMLDRLERDGVPGGLTFTLTPTLAAMLHDPLLQIRTRERLDKLCELAQRECARHAADALQPAAAHYAARFAAVRDYHAQCGGDLISRFRHHRESGRVEILTCAATHALLPLLSDPRAVERQIAVGVRSYREMFGEAPRGIWLPECAYFPEAGAMLAKHGIDHTILAAHAFLYAAPRPGAGVYAPLQTPEGLTVFGRDPECSQQVWSAAEGYPGDGAYREFYRDLGRDAPLEDVNPYLRAPGLRHDLGIKYHRVTGKCGLDQKEYYFPEAAAARAREHARDFLAKRGAQTQRLRTELGDLLVLTAPYDAELFGHWWYEGPIFLEEVLRAAARADSPVTCATLEAARARAKQTAAPAVSSWGDRGYFTTWLNGETDWIYPRLFAAQERMNALEDGPGGFARRVRTQAARELLLAQASDWPFIITTGTMADYARRRIAAHLDNFSALADWCERPGAPEEAIRARLEALENENNLFSAAVIGGE